MTVAEDEAEVSVMIRRKGYLNHYAIVTCSSLADGPKQQQVQFEPGEEVKPCVVPLNADDAFQVIFFWPWNTRCQTDYRPLENRFIPPISPPSKYMIFAQGAR